MAHIPPGQANGKDLIATGEEVVDAYKESMTANVELDPDFRQSMRQWFLDNDVGFTEQIYSFDGVIPGSGKFVISQLI
ncbi:Uu.00g103400.m01.CDS01 [Anthostomella pinea]|uniref:Uu.00g103400.m01.CDS01 n=1 Tax=Anthostomella pinea TaxID=933095 RepID=A0AAI8VEJ9_9PEZI|nr:Uu.00g103400.m01.CDS01 [Anthostomella pinea]